MKRYRLKPYMESEFKVSTPKKGKEKFPDDLREDLEEIDNQTNSIRDAVKLYLEALVDLEDKIVKRERLGGLELPEYFQIYQTLRLSIEKLNDVDSLVQEMEVRLNRRIVVTK